jgi:hypothetical protein
VSIGYSKQPEKTKQNRKTGTGTYLSKINWNS